MRRSDGLNILERKEQSGHVFDDEDYSRAYSTIPGFHMDYLLPSQYEIERAYVVPALKKFMGKPSPTKKPAGYQKKMGTQLKKLKGAKSPTKKPAGYEKKMGTQLKKLKGAVSPTKKPVGYKKILGSEIARLRGAVSPIKKPGVAPAEMFGSIPLSQAGKILNAKRAGLDTAKLEEGMKLIKSTHGMRLLADAQAVRANEINASRATDPLKRKGFINQANIARRAVEVEYAGWREAHLASGYLKNPAIGNAMAAFLPGMQKVINGLDVEGKTLTGAEKALLKAPIPVPIKTALNVGGEYLLGVATGDPMDANDMRASIVRNVSGIDVSKVTGDLTKDIPLIAMQIIKAPFAGFGFEAYEEPKYKRIPPGFPGYTDIPEPKRTVVLI